jgi:AraC family transcriptional regulator, regulatory protein of adaptative response / methylated-DNA-[protein]-cysteine methyltransferase
MKRLFTFDEPKVLKNIERNFSINRCQILQYMEGTSNTIVLKKHMLAELAIDILIMTKEETMGQCLNLKICYSFDESPFGKIMIASTEKGICSVCLALENEITAIQNLERLFSRAQLIYEKKTVHNDFMKVFEKQNNTSVNLTLHLKGTEFQLKVWNELLKIPFGSTVSYSHIASSIGHAKACRAVGSAVGDNPVFYLIPCHRVIKSTGAIGQYFWGTEIKKTILEWEKAKLFQ